MEYLAVIFGIAGLIWGALLLRHGGLLAGCLAVMLAGACFSVPFFKTTVGPLPLTADRILFLVVVGQYLLWRRWDWADPKPWGKPEALLAIFAVIMIFSTFSSDYTAENWQAVSWLIIYYLMPFGMYWIVRQTAFMRKSIWMFFGCLTAFGVYLSLTSLAEYFQIWELVFPRYIVSSISSDTAEFVGRARGPFLNPISNGIALSICFAAALLIWPRLNRPARLLMIPLYLLFLAAISATMTRSVWLSGAMAIGLVLCLSLPWSWRVPLIGGAILLALILVFTEWRQLVSFKRDRDLGAEKTAESVELRPIMAMVAWKMFLDHPVFGCGYSQYKTEHVNYLSDRSTTLVLEKARPYIAHNVVLSLLTETGLVGLGVFLAMIFFWTRDAWRLWRLKTTPLEARLQGLLMLVVLQTYFINGMFHDVSAVPMANMTLFFLAGVTAAMRPWTASASSGQWLVDSGQ
ncbi:MAG: O-antigen ligase family protein [Thermoguttaceae bacterium]